MVFEEQRGSVAGGGEREREGGGKGRGVAQLHQAFSELTNTYTLIHSRL